MSAEPPASRPSSPSALRGAAPGELASGPPSARRRAPALAKGRQVAGALGLTLALFLPTGCADEAAERPNVLLVTLDTTRADRLGAYGREPTLTPELDSLAQAGTVFTRAIAQAAVTPVSHASILTGLEPPSHGLRVMHGISSNRITDEQVTLAELLRAAGYRTAAFVSAFPVSEYFGLHQGFEQFGTDFLSEPIRRIVSRSGVINTGRNQRHAGETSDLAVDWIASAEEPFHLWLHYFDPHDPVVGPPQSYVEEHLPDGGSDDLRSRLRAFYDMEVSYMDSQIARVLRALEARRSRERTLVVVVADHGEGLGDHDWWSHGILYQEQIHVPLILAGPGVPAGRRVDDVVRTTDILPTVLELAGIPREGWPAIDGLSLADLFAGGAPAPGRVAYADSLNTLTYRIRPGLVDEKDRRLFAVVEWPWKYIQGEPEEGDGELYHLGEDPGEQVDLSGERPAAVARMRQLLDARRSAEAPSRPTIEGMDPEALERLRALGYVE